MRCLSNMINMSKQCFNRAYLVTLTNVVGIPVVSWWQLNIMMKFRDSNADNQFNDTVKKLSIPLHLKVPSLVPC